MRSCSTPRHMYGTVDKLADCDGLKRSTFLQFRAARECARFTNDIIGACDLRYSTATQSHCQIIPNFRDDAECQHPLYIVVTPITIAEACS